MNEEIESKFTEDFILDTIFSEVKKKKRITPPEQYRGICPFPGHSGKDTTDFSINIKNTKYHCYGCSESGNYISFIKKIKNISEPIKWLKEQLNIPATPQKKDEPSKKTVNYDFVLAKHEALMAESEHLQEIINILKITKEVVGRYMLGWDGDYYTIPILDESGNCVNLIRYNPNKNPKVKGFPGCLGKHLFPSKNLIQNKLYILEGEKDTIFANSLGLPAITNVLGVNNWNNSWGKFFKDKDVYICMDVDNPGREGAEIRIRSIFPYAKTVRNVELPLDKEKYPKGDFFNYIIDEGHTIEDFKNLCDKTSIVKVSLTNDAVSIDVAKYIVKQGLFCHVPEQGFFSYNHTGEEQGIFSFLHDAYVSQYILKILEQNKLKVSSNKVNDILKLLKISDEILVDREFKFNPEKNLLCLQNGVYNTDTGDLLSFDKKYRINNKVNIAFDETAKCDTWLRCLDTWSCKDDSWIAFNQEMFGVCFINRIIRGNIFFLLGEGRNGKNKMLNCLIELLGRKNVSSFDINQLDEPFAVIQLKDKMLNVASEINCAKMHATNTLKKIATGDMLTGRHLFRGYIEFFPTVKMVFSGNKLPSVNDKSFGWERRIKVIPFEHIITETEDDPFLDDKLAEELPGIFNWAIEGKKRFQETNNFTYCDRIEKAKQQYILETSSVRLFLEENCTLLEDERVSKIDFRRHYNEWCKEQNRKAVSDVELGKELKRVGVRTEGAGSQMRVNGQLIRYYLGVQLDDLAKITDRQQHFALD